MRLEVDLTEDAVSVMQAIMAGESCTAAEAIHRAIASLDFFLRESAEGSTVFVEGRPLGLFRRRSLKQILFKQTLK